MIKYLFDKNELKFINLSKKNKKYTNKEFLMIQCVEDYYFLLLYKEIIKVEKKEVIGFITMPLNISLTDSLLVIPFILKLIKHEFRKYRWKKLYSSIGVTSFLNPSELFFINFIKNFKSVLKTSRLIKTKKSLNDLYINDLKIGDILYDTIVRFNSLKPTVRLKGYLYFKFLALALEMIRFNNKLLKKVNFSKCFFTQGVYLHHGLPVRQFVNNNKEVYTIGGLFQMFKINTRDHYLMEKDFRFHKKNFDLKFSNNEISLAKKQFSIRFKGLDDNGQVNFFDVNPYGDKKVRLNKSIDGVLFLHDFYDSQKIMGESIFNDFLEWFEFTVHLIKKHDLNIGIKPHPHDLTIESKRFVDKLKKKYTNLNWIDKKMSNTTIFDSNIKFGITHHGTVASELAYFGIIPITCAENPTSSFNFTKQARSKEEYANIICKIKNSKFKIDKKEVFKFYYMHYMVDVDDYKKLDKKVLKKISLTNRYLHDSKTIADF